MLLTDDALPDAVGQGAQEAHPQKKDHDLQSQECFGETENII